MTRVCEQPEYNRQMWAWQAIGAESWYWCDDCRLPHTKGHECPACDAFIHGNPCIHHNSGCPSWAA